MSGISVGRCCNCCIDRFTCFRARGGTASSDEDENVIVVTGRLRGNESVQDVPLSVTVVNTEQLGAQGALTIEDVETLSLT